MDSLILDRISDTLRKRKKVKVRKRKKVRVRKRVRVAKRMGKRMRMRMRKGHSLRSLRTPFGPFRLSALDRDVGHARTSDTLRKRKRVMVGEEEKEMDEGSQLG